MNLFEKVVKYVDESFGEKMPHFERTVFWIKHFLPNTNEAHKIAAYSHDIERGLNGEKDRDYTNRNFIDAHQKKSAQIMADFLKNQSADKNLINIVISLIGNHEFGGDEEQNALMDADSVSFFETNAEMFVNKRAKIEGYKKVKEKLDWMFSRISSEEHKKFARKNYEKWIKALDNYK